mgnify:CR=1 FL=1
MKSSYNIILLLLLFTKSCEELDTASEIPRIQYQDFIIKEYSPSGGSLSGTLVFRFTDGDGDVGLAQPQYDDSVTIDSIPYNLFIDRFDFEAEEYQLADTSLRFRLPYMEGGTYKENLEGTVEIQLYYPYVFSDSIRFHFYLFDRSGNKSNIEQSPSIGLN